MKVRVQVGSSSTSIYELHGHKIEVEIKRVGFRRYTGSIVRTDPGGGSDGAKATGSSASKVRSRLGLHDGWQREWERRVLKINAQPRLRTPNHDYDPALDWPDHYPDER